MPGIKFKADDRITIAGLPGTGKTTLAKYLGSLLVPHLLIYDPLAQYEGFPDECRYIPKSDSLEEFDGICRQLRAKGDTTFLIEESERYLGQGKPLHSNTFDLINRGRNWGVGVIAVTRRIQRLSKDYFDLCQRHFLFKCGLKSREYIAEMIGKDRLRDIMRLAEYHFLYYDINTETSSVHFLTLGPTERVEEARGEKPSKEPEAKPKEEGDERIESTAASSPHTED